MSAAHVEVVVALRQVEALHHDLGHAGGRRPLAEYVPEPLTGPGLLALLILTERS